MTVDSLYLENIDEFINDENKIVTYKWLSLTLQVQCNTAKQMLYKFVQDERNEKDNDKLNVTYFVSGLSKPDDTGDQAFKCAVVPEEKLETYKSSLVVVTSCHIYSVQKTKLKSSSKLIMDGPQAKPFNDLFVKKYATTIDANYKGDSNALYITDFEKLKENVFEGSKYSSIQHEKAKLRSQEELDKLAPIPPPTAQQDKKPTPSTNGHSSTTASKTTGKKQPQSAIANMFAKSDKTKKAPKEENKKSDKTKKASKEENKKSEVKTEEPTARKENKDNKASAKGGNKKPAGMTAFFSKQTDKKPAAKSPPKSAEVSTKKSPLKGKGHSPIVSKSKKNARPVDSDEEEEVGQTKRRRIKADLFESDSDEDMEEEDDEPIPPTPPPREPTPEPTPEPKPRAESPITVDEKEDPIPKKTSPGKDVTKGSNSGERKRKRTRKFVPKTYMDDDGFMVTEKVWESDSTDASEVEEPVPAKSTKAEPTKAKPSPTKGKKKGSPKKSPQGKKGAQGPGSGKQQTSLMSFFKKA